MSSSLGRQTPANMMQVRRRKPGKHQARYRFLLNIRRALEKEKVTPCLNSTVAQRGFQLCSLYHLRKPMSHPQYGRTLFDDGSSNKCHSTMVALPRSFLWRDQRSKQHLRNKGSRSVAIAGTARNHNFLYRNEMPPATSESHACRVKKAGIRPVTT